MILNDRGKKQSAVQYQITVTISGFRLTWFISSLREPALSQAVTIDLSKAIDIL